MRGGGRHRSDQRADAAGVRGPEGFEQENLAGRGDANRRQAARCHRPAEGGAFRFAAAEDPLRQDAAPLDPGARRRARPGRPHDDRRSQRFGANQTGPAMKTRPMLTLDDCRKISAAAEAEAKKNNWNVVIAILDDGGHLLHLVRMDGATPANARIAVEKGRTAAETRRSTLAWQERIKARPEMLKMPEVTPIQGGLPITVEGTCVGGVGISGVQSHEDEQIAAAGIKALTG